MSKIFNFPSDQFDAVVVGEACNPLPPSSAAFVINSTTKGTLLSRLTDVEMNAIVAPVEGLIVYNLNHDRYYYFDGLSWVAMDSGAGSVTSVAISSDTTTNNALLVTSGSPITSSGTIHLALSVELVGLSGISTNGLIVRTGAGTYTEASISGTTGNITVNNGNGSTGNINIDLPNVGTPVTTSLVNITTDAKGRITATTLVSSSNVISALGYTPVNKAGDVMLGSLSAGGFKITNLSTPTVSTDAVTKQYVDYTDVVSVTANYLATLTNVVILCNGLLTVTLPTAVGAKGKTYHVKNIGTQTVTINTAGGVIDGNTGILITRRYDSYMIVSDDINWYVV